MLHWFNVSLFDFVFFIVTLLMLHYLLFQYLMLHCVNMALYYVSLFALT